MSVVLFLTILLLCTILTITPLGSVLKNVNGSTDEDEPDQPVPPPEEPDQPDQVEEISNMTLATGPGGTIPSMSTPGEKTFYMFTSEVEDVNEEKLKIAGDSFDVKTLIANKGDKITLKFYNVDEVQTERHSLTIGDPYKVDIDVGFAENKNATFTANQTGVFTYYCKYHLPVMTGQLLVLP